MAQTRKKTILQQVQRQRRNRTIATMVVAVVLIGVIVSAVAFLAPKASLVPLPGYLDTCASSVAYHAHVNLSLNISGSPMVVPAGLGITGGCNRPLHTHATDGVIHIEPNEARDYTLGDFLLIWGNSLNDPQYTILNSTQVFSNRGHVTITVNGAPPPLPVPGDIKSYILPRNAGTNGNPTPCSELSKTPPGTCVPTSVVITYTP